MYRGEGCEVMCNTRRYVHLLNISQTHCRGFLVGVQLFSKCGKFPYGHQTGHIERYVGSVCLCICWLEVDGRILIQMNNPFNQPEQISNSCYCIATDDGVTLPEHLALEGVDVMRIHRQLRDKIIKDSSYPCVAAKSAFNNDAYRFGVYRTLGSHKAAAGLARDLFTFLHDRERIEARFATFLAIFLEPRQVSEETFEDLLWTQLYLLHELDRPFHSWTEDASPNPKSKRFGFSFGETAFFIVGMHANSSRLARQFPFPMLVFNLHSQFDELREEERFERMKSVIRERDLEVQGSLNPMLSDFGTHSEAIQYSGRAVENGWRCPVHFEKEGESV